MHTYSQGSYDDHRHLYFVYPLIGLAAMATLAAILIPLFSWMFSAAGFVSILLAMGTAKEYGLILG